MISDKIIFYNNIYKFLLGTGIILLILSFTFFYTSNLKIYFQTRLKMDEKKKNKVKEKRKNKRSKNIYETNDFKEIDYDQSHEIKDPSVELKDMTGVLNDETDELANQGEDTTGSLNLEDVDGEKETTLLSDLNSVEKPEESKSTDILEDKYFDDIPTDDGTLLFESPGEDETSLLTQNDLEIKKIDSKNRLWTKGLKYFDVNEEKDTLIIGTKERI